MVINGDIPPGKLRVLRTGTSPLVGVSFPQTIFLILLGVDMSCWQPPEKIPPLINKIPFEKKQTAFKEMRLMGNLMIHGRFVGEHLLV